ncbi:hypothetical protein B484DRAFT_389988 [Ochromonadaceae sp. CCMP2298]|nr:hypothetical protein B484DRAFT_389988 [Ochromonadaceae sp. CCMP2298]
MLKMLPEGAVRQKMMGDGFSESEINNFITNGPPLISPPPDTSAPAPAAAAPAAAAPLDPRLEKYAKMKKLLPEGAVRQKMQMDGFSPEEIEAVFGGGGGGSGSAGGGGGVGVGVGASPPPLTPAEAIRFAKYDKMAKMLPEGAVRQKMVGDGVDAADIDRFLRSIAKQPPSAAAAPKPPPAPLVEAPPEGMSAKPKLPPPPGVKMKGLFWTKLANKGIKNTLWHQLDELSLQPEEVQRLRELFGAATATGAELQAKAQATREREERERGRGGKKLSLLDAQRTQNVLIILGKVRYISAL